MKTLLFTLEYPPFHGGIANYYGNLVKYWPAPENILILNNNDGRLINNKLPLLKWLPAYFALAVKIKQEKIEHIIVGHILPLGTVALICSWFFKIKYSVFLHGLDLSSAVKKSRKKWLTERIMKKAEKIICINNYTANLTKQFFPLSANKITTINPGIEPALPIDQENISKLREKYNLENKIILLSVGRLVKRKGFDKVIEAMPGILKQIPNLAYVILGNGEEIENLKLNNSVKIITNTSNEERNSWYNASDIFIMPSRNIDGDFEGFGIVYLEANLAGKPVVAGKSGGVGDAVIDGLNGLLVNPEDTGQITSAVIKLAQNPELRKKLGEQGKIRAINDFNWPKQINKIYKAITI
ncbi:MAG: glycosyltransferase family 4 protein [bacterium]|nr:glycosyltransferase family 4 protein [bacterium]